ncbi:MAG TPA: histidine ammonia-lyase [Pyrinomonadaceae bacterium]|nr:histidine ammonia-lyase [Pyrinomonadaceae bacterium]
MIELNGQSLTLEQVAAVARGAEGVQLGEGARGRMEASRALVERIVEEGRVVYGVNTGFGKLSDYSIPRAELRELQLNLVRSHACGVGAPLSAEETRAMMLLRANVLALGYSGARPVVAEILIEMLERNVVPVVPEKGSVGASGDLAPLAHLALACIGEGESFYEGARMPSADALKRAGLRPIELEAKEGLALLNGTQALTAVGALALRRAEQLARASDVAGAMSLEALRGTPAPFDARLHDARPHPGQKETAAHLCELLDGSEIRESHLKNDPRVQDAYSLRCMPQVHGAARDCFRQARATIEIETGAATDNPLVFADTNEIISGGNFHGAPVALQLDYAAVALTHLMNISERRIERLVNPDMSEGLPAFLTSHPGTSSGFMIAQVAAVALLNEMKVLAHPATTDNLPTSAGKEDHVSMGMTAAAKLRAMVTNAEYVLAIELLAAAEGLEYRAPLKPGRGVLRAYELVRAHAPRLTRDRALSPDIERLAEVIKRGEFDF